MRINTAEVRVQTLASRLTNMSVIYKMELLNMRFDGKAIVVTVSVDTLKRLTILLDEKSIPYTIIKRNDFPTLATQVLRRFPLVIGIFIAVFILIFFPMYTTEIRLAENGILNVYELRAFLVEQGISTTGILGKEELNAVRNAVSGLEGVGNVNVEKVGNVLFVEIREELPKSDYSTPSVVPLVSEYDAVITSVVVTSGTAVVSKGAIVKRGDVLIQPYYEANEMQYETTASGVVYGDVMLYERIVLPKEYEVAEFSGEVASKVSISLFGMKIERHFKESPFDNYTITTTTNSLGGLLPVKFIQQKAREITYRTIQLDEAYIADVLMPSVYAEMDESFARAHTTVYRNYFCKTLDNYYVLDVYYTVNTAIVGGG